MKIGIDGRAAKWYRGTGIGTYTYQLINCLNKIDKINDYLLFMPKDSKYKMHLNSNFNLTNISEGNCSSFWDEVNIPNILRDKDIDLYHVPQNGVGLPVNKKCYSVITLHDVIPFRMPETVSKRYMKIFSESLPEIIKVSDGIITVSNYSKRDIIKTFNYPQDKIHVTYLASESIYKPLNKEISKMIIKRKYSIDENYILYVGGFSPRKNISGLIQAFSIFANKDNPNLKLVIAGKRGESYKNYLELTYKLKISDKVIFPGFIPTMDLPFLYNAASVFVYPSFYEGFGLPPIEAMACGIPIISSNITSMPEIIGTSGLLINPYNIEELSSAITNVLSDNVLAEKLSASGIKRSTEFSWEKTAAESLSFYNKIIS